MASQKDEGHDYAVAAAPEWGFAFYVRYPRGFGDWPTGAEDLTCPNCGADEIVCVEDSTALGKRAQCWVCKQDFRITENCWKHRKIG